MSDELSEEEELNRQIASSTFHGIKQEEFEESLNRNLVGLLNSYGFIGSVMGLGLGKDEIEKLLINKMTKLRNSVLEKFKADIPSEEDYYKRVQIAKDTMPQELKDVVAEVGGKILDESYEDFFSQRISGIEEVFSRVIKEKITAFHACYDDLVDMIEEVKGMK